MPYKTNSQVSVLSQSFLSETESNLLFRIYVPSSRIWAQETDKLLLLFKDYLANIGHQGVRLDQQRTDKGIIYEFHGEELKGQNGLASEFSDFTGFMNLCANDQKAAHISLSNSGVNEEQIPRILTRYAKEAKRLYVDIKQEYEVKILSIKHRLESELTDNMPLEVKPDDITILIENALPAFAGIETPLKHEGILPSEVRNNSLTINIKPQIVEAANCVIAQEINGNQNIGACSEELLQLINQFAGKDTNDLTSAVYELEDESVPNADRLKAKQKLKKFLITVGKKSGDIGMKILQKYIESQVGL